MVRDPKFTVSFFVYFHYLENHKASFCLGFIEFFFQLYDSVTEKKEFDIFFKNNTLLCSKASKDWAAGCAYTRYLLSTPLISLKAILDFILN
jgi:hypothetical protein